MKFQVVASPVICTKFDGPFKASLACIYFGWIFGLQSFPLQSDEDFAQLQVVALTRGRHSETCPRTTGHGDQNKICFGPLFFI